MKLEIHHAPHFGTYTALSSNEVVHHALVNQRAKERSWFPSQVSFHQTTFFSRKPLTFHFLKSLFL